MIYGYLVVVLNVFFIVMVLGLFLNCKPGENVNSCYCYEVLCC